MISGFHIPKTAQEAVELRASLGEGAHFLGGGTELNSLTPPPGPIEHLISLDRLNLRSVRVNSKEIEIGACCTLQEIIEAKEIPEVLRRACLQVENRSIRNQATIGGHIAAAHPYASVLPLLLALDSKVDVIAADGSSSTDPITEHIGGLKGALITGVRIPVFSGGLHAAVAQHCRSAIDLAMLSVAVSCRLDGDLISTSRIVLGGLGRMPQRLIRVEERLEGSSLPPREALESMVAKQAEAETDSRGTAEFKGHMAGVLVANALMEVVS